MAEYLTKTYALRQDGDEWGLRGSVDDMEALKQAISLRLQIEQGAEEIYSEGYGLAVKDLLGRDYPYVAAELERRIKESLLADDRILAVEDMSLTADGRRVSANFVVKSVYGESEESAKVVL